MNRSLNSTPSLFSRLLRGWPWLAGGLGLAVLAVNLGLGPLIRVALLQPSLSLDQPGMRVEVFDQPRISGPPARVLRAADSAKVDLAEAQSALAATSLWRVDRPGRFGLLLNCDDLGRVFLDGREVIPSTGPAQGGRALAEADLGAGFHLLTVHLINGPGPGHFTLLVREPTQTGWRPLAGAELGYPDLGSLRTWSDLSRVGQAPWARPLGAGLLWLGLGGLIMTGRLGRGCQAWVERWLWLGPGWTWPQGWRRLGQAWAARRSRPMTWVLAGLAAVALAPALTQVLPLGPDRLVFVSDSGGMDPTGPLGRGAEAGFTFQAPADGLTGLGVRFATYDRTNYVRVRLELYRADSGELVRTAHLGGEHLRDWEFGVFRFRPVPDSAGARFRATVTSPDAEAAQDQVVSLVKRPGRPAPGGTELIIDGRPQEGGVPIQLWVNRPWTAALVWAALLLTLVAVLLRPTVATAATALIGAYLVVRLLAFLQVGPDFQGKDSEVILSISTWPVWSGRFLANYGPFVAPLVHKLMGRDYELITWAHLAVSLTGWLGLSLAAARAVTSRWLKPVALGLILLFSLSLEINPWDRVLRTESLSYSLLAGFTALWLAASARWRTLGGLALAGLFLAFARDSNAYLVLGAAGLVALPAAAGLIQRRWLWLSAVYLVVFALNWWSVEAGPRWLTSYYNLMGQRVLKSQDMTAYFAAQGMPLDQALRERTGRDAGDDGSAFRVDPRLEAFRKWTIAQGKRTYMGYLLTHPGHFWLTPVEDGRARDETFGSQAPRYWPKGYAPALAEGLHRLLYPRRADAVWLACGLAALVLIGLAWQRRSLPWAWAVALALTLLTYPLGMVVWHADSYDHDRHLIQVGLQLRLGLWLLALFALDGLAGLVRRRSLRRAE